MRRRALVLAGLAALLPLRAAAQGVYIAENGEVTGPFDEAALRQRLGSQTGAAQTQVWMQGMPDWAAATNVPALSALVSALPLDPPFVAGAFVLGTWQSTDHALATDNGGIMGRITYVFDADGTFSASFWGQSQTVTSRPTDRPGEFWIDSRPRSLDRRIIGSYALAEGRGGYFTVRMKGQATEYANGKAGTEDQWREDVDFRQTGPDQMQTRYGVRFGRINR